MELLESEYKPYIETGIHGLRGEIEYTLKNIHKSITSAAWFVVTANYIKLQLEYLLSAYLCSPILMPIGLIYLIAKFTGYGEKFADSCLDKALKIFKSDVKVATIPTIFGAIAVFALTYVNLISVATAALITFSVRAASFALGVVGALIPQKFNAYMGAFLKAIGIDGMFPDVNAQLNMATRKRKVSGQDELHFNEIIAESTGAALGAGTTLGVFVSAVVPATVAGLTTIAAVGAVPLAVSAGIGAQACRSLLLYKRKIFGDGTDTGTAPNAPVVADNADNADNVVVQRPQRRQRVAA